MKQLLAPTGATLERLAADGACVYVSYSPGDIAWHRGPSYGRLNEMFGVRHQLDVGLVDPIEDDVVDVHGSAGTSAAWPAGPRSRFRRRRATSTAASYLPVAAGHGAEVIATDARGRPALLRRQVGPRLARSCAPTRSSTWPR